jgi:PPP family 3-phenylpropionic acid transporter
MPSESQIPTPSYLVARRFAGRLALFYGATFAVVGTYLPFFTVWLRAIGIDASWIGVIIAVPSVTRFTILPFITATAERRQALRGALIVTAIATVAGFTLLGTLRQPLAVFIVFALTACAWTPMVPLTDGYALKAVARFGLNYGPLRLWGSAAFVVGALAAGALVDVIAAENLIWIIAGVAALGALASFGLKPLEEPTRAPAAAARPAALLRSPGFLTIIVAAALIQGSHAAYYTFASIAWQGSGYGGMTIAGLWVLGVAAEIAVFALSPRFTLSPALLMVFGALSAVARWLIVAQNPPLGMLAVVQLLHGLTYGLTQVGTMGLLIRHVPGHVIARAQGYLTACTGIAMSSAAIVSGAIYAAHGQGVYYVMAAMAMAGAIVIALARRGLDAPRPVAAQPHSAGSGG